MNERLLQFIWQFQYFNHSSLTTTAEQPLEIIHGGVLNRNQGPDFNEARIKINNTLWIGNIELHVQSSHWREHNHSADKNYECIILHVVWKHDEEITDTNGEAIATLELQSLVPKITLQRFEQLMGTGDFIPCSFSLPVLSEIAWLGWKERLIIERLQEKSQLIIQRFDNANQHWEEVFWQSLTRSFGMKVNADAFEHIAKSVSVNLLAKHKNQIHQLEALLLGQAGLLDEPFNDPYAIMLHREYRFLAKKYGLQPLNLQPAFLRMRPANFPTLRLAQLAMLVYQSAHLFSKVKTATHPNEIFQWFDITANDFWSYHYTLSDTAAYQPKSLGISLIQHIVINAIIPVFFAYGLVNNEHAWKDKAVNWLMCLPPEHNSITKQWKLHYVENKNACDSQALIQLKTSYCDNRKCLDCAVGTKLLRD